MASEDRGGCFCGEGAEGGEDSGGSEEEGEAEGEEAGRASFEEEEAEELSTMDILKAHIEKRAAEEGYGDYLNNLRVELEKANTSSLDIVAIADFDGEVADLYGRLGRALQRWSVEACTINNWEIPFTQLTLHHPEGADAVRE